MLSYLKRCVTPIFSMKKILFLSFYIFFATHLFAQQKDTLTLIVGKKSDDYIGKSNNGFSEIENALTKIIQTTASRFFLDNAGIKSEFVKCYFDTSILKTSADKEMATQMIKEKYAKQQGDFLKINKKPFIDIEGKDAEEKPFAIHDFIGKTTVIGVNNDYIGNFFEPMYKDLDSIKRAFPNVNVAMLTEAMTVEINQAMQGKLFTFPIVPNCKEVLEANVSNHFLLPYYIILDKSGIIKDMIFIYDSSGLFSFENGYNIYNLQTWQKAKVEFSYFSDLKKIFAKLN